MTDSKAIHKIQRTVSIIHNPLTGWVVLVLSLVVTVAAYYYTSSQLEERIRDRFEFRAHEIGVAIVDRLNLYGQTLIAGAAYFTASDQVSRQDWRHFVERVDMRTRLPGMQGMGFAKLLQPEQLADHIQTIRDEGFPHFEVKPVGKRELYTSIQYLEPFDWRNRRAFGYDMWSNPMRREAMALARDLAVPVASGLITLVQETDRDVQKGFLAYVPVYRTERTPLTVPRRRHALTGWVYAAFRSDDLMSGILGTQDADLSFKIYDGREPSEATLLFSSEHRPEDFQNSTDPGFRYTETLDILGRLWTVEFFAPGNLLQSSPEANQPLYILATGILVDLLLFYVLISLHLINNHRKQAEQELRLEHERNLENLNTQKRRIATAEKESETFFDLAPQAFLVVDADGRIVKANKQAHDLFGFIEGAFQGITVEQLIPPSLRRQHSQNRAGYMANQERRLMGSNAGLAAQKQNGDIFPASINLAPIDYMGAPHTVAVVTDITAQKQFEKSLAEAKENAESASRSKSEFVANMSHEIRTPLNAVLGSAQLLQQTEPTAHQQKYIQMIRSSGEALLGVINDILDFSKIEAGAMELADTPFELNEVLSSVAIMMSVNVGEKPIELAIKVENGVAQQFVGDPLRLQQVLINLVSNAIKFTESGHVMLRIKGLDIAGQSMRQTLQITVDDTGIGMSPEQISRLFRAFAQADTTISRKFGGTGLGLVISNRICEMMGGRIEIESAPGKGSKFFFEVTLPLAGASSEEIDFLDSRARRVLILASHATTREALVDLCLQWGWRACGFEQASDAVNGMLASELDRVDYVIVDDNIAQDGNDEPLALLRRAGLADSAACLLLLSNNQQAMIWMSMGEKRYDASLVKPATGASLLAALQEATIATTGFGLLSIESSTSEERGKLKGLKILLVEDNPFNQTIASAMLEEMGAIVSIANHGREAVERINENNLCADVILMDIQMPVMDGLTATNILRDELHWDKPIIAMTAGVLNSERDQYLKCGMNGFVPKPVDHNDLFQAISHCVHPGSDAKRHLQAAVGSKPPSRPAADDFCAVRLEKLCTEQPLRVKRILRSVKRLCDQPPEVATEPLQRAANEDLSLLETELQTLKEVFNNYGGEKTVAEVQALQNQLHTLGHVEIASAINAIRQSIGEYQVSAQAWLRHRQAES